jgi:hypothetical protein
MKAIAKAPPEIRANNKSGKLLAALKTSNSSERPNCRPMITVRNTPSNLSAPKRTANIKEMRVNLLNFFKPFPSLGALINLDYAIIHIR